MKARFFIVLAVAAAIGLLWIAPTQAGDSIDFLGWTLELGDFVISDILADQGEPCMQAEVGGGIGSNYWSAATKPIGPHLLSAEEPLVLEYVVMLPDSNWEHEHIVAVMLRNASTAGWRWSIGFRILSNVADFRTAMGYDKDAPPVSAPVSEGDVIDLKLEVYRTVTKSYWRMHGDPSWTLITSYGSDNPGSTPINQVRMIASNGNDLSYLDSVRVSTATQQLLWEPFDTPVAERAITGVVELGDYAGDADVAVVKVELYVSDTLKATEYLFGGGAFAFTELPPLDYQVVIRTAKWLNQTIPVTVGETDVDLGTITLVNGDMDGDGSIDNADADVVVGNLE